MSMVAPSLPAEHAQEEAVACDVDELWLADEFGEGSTGLPLPKIEENLFHRIIRNPFPAGRAPRELACSQMLCAVLQNAPTLRLRLLQWLAKQANAATPDLGQLDFDFETEQRTIEAKRDDLRISGFSRDVDEPCQVLLWTIEVKVEAPFSRSRAMDGQEQDTDRSGSVHQIRHYDTWLARQQPTHKAGFVLGVRRLGHCLPGDLACTWSCTTWTELGAEVEAALREKLPESAIPSAERLLGEHFLGFIRRYLWRSDNMPTSKLKLTFNAVAFLRAVGRFGAGCEKKVLALTSNFEQILRKSRIARGPIQQHLNVFKPWPAGASYSQYVFPRGSGKDPKLLVGITGNEDYECPSVEVILVIPIDLDRTRVFQGGLPKTRQLLQRRKQRWVYQGPDGEDATATSFLCDKPLTDVLEREDQDSIIEEFVASSLDDLKAAKIVQLLEKASAELKKKRPANR